MLLFWLSSSPISFPALFIFLRFRIHLLMSQVSGIVLGYYFEIRGNRICHPPTLQFLCTFLARLLNYISLILRCQILVQIFKRICLFCWYAWSLSKIYLLSFLGGLESNGFLCLGIIVVAIAVIIIIISSKKPLTNLIIYKFH